jgi:hypothetical protein
MALKDLHIEGTEFTPEIVFSSGGTFHISGISRPEDVFNFYQSPVEWLKKFKDEILVNAPDQFNSPALHFVFKMKYFNSASAKHLLRMLDILKGFEEMGFELKLDWYHEEADEQLLEDGQDLSDAVDIPFNYIPLKE